MLCHSLRVVLVEVRYRIDLHGRTNAEDLDGPQDAGQGDVHPGTQGPHGNDAGCCCGHVSIVAQRGSLPDDGFPMVGRCSGNVQVHPQAALFATGVADAGRRTGWAAADFAIRAQAVGAAARATRGLDEQDADRFIRFSARPAHVTASPACRVRLANRARLARLARLVPEIQSSCLFPRAQLPAISGLIAT